MVRKKYQRCPYKRKSIDGLKHLAKQRCILLPPLCTQKDLVRLLKQQDLHDQPYLKYTVKDLKKFIEDRKIINKWSESKKKESLMLALTNADDSWEFPLLCLPPELRIIIYEFSMAVESASKSQLNLPKQPALTQVSKLVRQESVPIFYKVTPFSMLYKESSDTSKLDSHKDLRMHTLEIPPRAGLRLEQIGDNNIRYITKLSFTSREIITRHYYLELRYDMSIPFSSSAQVSVEPVSHNLHVLSTKDWQLFQEEIRRRGQFASELLKFLLKTCEGGRPTRNLLVQFGMYMPARLTRN